ncbi:MAG: hypothetical protein HC814_03510, partial [Rhodobacteraceae bacterium]|nr:hypothetical protein [Paracoccaceae bacterium]
FARALTLLQSISLTGGYMDDADRGRIRIQRTDPSGERRVLTVDLTGVEVDGDMSRDIPLEDGDTVFVPRAEEVSVLGQVGAPGTFIIPSGQPPTLLRAIARTGGFTRLAKQSAVVWIRKTREGGKPTVVDADASDEDAEIEDAEPAIEDAGDEEDDAALIEDADDLGDDDIEDVIDDDIEDDPDAPR